MAGVGPWAPIRPFRPLCHGEWVRGSGWSVLGGIMGGGRVVHVVYRGEAAHRRDGINIDLRVRWLLFLAAHTARM